MKNYNDPYQDRRNTDTEACPVAAPERDFGEKLIEAIARARYTNEHLSIALLSVTGTKPDQPNFEEPGCHYHAVDILLETIGRASDLAEELFLKLK